MKIRLEFQRHQSQRNDMKRYVAQGHRRLVASEPIQQSQYIDYRNLWKASTPNQQKQYQAIRESGLMSEQRKITFLKFNYRQSQDKNLTYNEVYNRMFKTNKKNTHDYDQQSKSRKKFKIKNETFIPFTKQIIQKINNGSLKNDKIFDVCFQSEQCENLKICQKEKCALMKKCSFGSRLATTHAMKRRSFLKKFQSTSQLRYLTGVSDENWFDKFCEHKNTEMSSSVDKNVRVAPGSMNVCDLWGERQLKESLGFLPCTRDRPKLLKMYSQNLGTERAKNQLKSNNVRCATEM